MKNWIAGKKQIILLMPLQYDHAVQMELQFVIFQVNFHVVRIFLSTEEESLQLLYLLQMTKGPHLYKGKWESFAKFCYCFSNSKKH